MKTTILTFAISLLSILSFAEEWSVVKDGITYASKDETTCYAKTAEKSITKAIIPSEVEGRKVTSIGVNCFDRCYHLETVCLPNTIERIEFLSFLYCRSLLELTIPESVTFIDDDAFDLCHGVESFFVSAANTSYCSLDGVLYTKDLSMLHSYPHGKVGPYVIPEGVKELSNVAFYFDQNIESITLSTTLETIPNTCFQGCINLKELIFPDNCQLKEIGHYSFMGSGLTGTLVLPNSVEKLGSHCFHGCVDLTTLWLPESIKEWNEGFEFYNCKSLDEIHVQSTEPHRIRNSTFGWSEKISIPRYLFVPQGCREKYENEGDWNKYFYILEEGQDRSEAGIEDVQADGQQDSPCYDLMGRVRKADTYNEILIKNGRKMIVH